MGILNQLGLFGGTSSIPWDDALLSATAAAHNSGKRLAEGRRWVETEAIEQRPLMTLSVVFGLGVLTGWFIKRR